MIVGRMEIVVEVFESCSWLCYEYELQGFVDDVCYVNYELNCFCLGVLHVLVLIVKESILCIYVSELCWDLDVLMWLRVLKV